MLYSVVLQVPLVEQHFNAEFQPFLKHTYKVERVSGDSQLKISFTEIVKNNDVIVCTAQILENYLERANTGEDEGVDLSGMNLHYNLTKNLLTQECILLFLGSIIYFCFSKLEYQSKTQAFKMEIRSQQHFFEGLSKTFSSVLV